MAYKVMVVDDEPGICLTLQRELTEAGFLVWVAHDGLEAIELFDGEPVHAVVLDLQMPNCDGLQCLRSLRRKAPSLIAVIITAYATLESAIEVMRCGADDYIVKPFDCDALVQKLDRLLRLKAALTASRAPRESESSLLGSAPAMEGVKRMVDKLKDSNTTVLITGESGTGKGVTAKQLHYSGRRAGRPFLYVDCSALPPTLIESELFGHERGAFTGATQSKKGKFEMAEDGTIFLDEITTLSLEMQAKLLTVLQERVVFRVGSTQPIPIPARFIAATNDRFDTAISQGRFREDLYYRLNVVNITLPPLRERREDIAPLAAHFFKKYAEENDMEGLTVDPEVFEVFQRYDWPGNVRELANTIEGGVVLSDGVRVTVEDLPSKLLRPPHIPAPAEEDEEPASLTLREREMRTIISALVRNGGHRERTAKELGISRRTLQNKIKKMNLEL